jgi:hypothetical protein
LLVSAFLRCGGVVAWLLFSGEGAVVLSVTLGGHGIVGMLSRATRLGTFLGSLSGWLSEGWEKIRFLLDLGLGAIWERTSACRLGGSHSPVRKGVRYFFLLFKCCLSHDTLIDLPVGVLFAERRGREQRLGRVDSVGHWRCSVVSKESLIRCKV